jgi:hypothetical protein
MLGSRRQRRGVVWVATVLALTGAGASPATARQPSRVTDQDVTNLLARIERNAEQFRRSLAHAPDAELIVGWEKARNIDQFVTRFVDATRRLRAQFDRGEVVAGRVDEVLRRGVSIDSFMERNRAPDQAARDWAKVRRDLETLAAAFNVPWNRATPRLTSAHPADRGSPQSRNSTLRSELLIFSAPL